MTNKEFFEFKSSFGARDFFGNTVGCRPNGGNIYLNLVGASLRNIGRFELDSDGIVFYTKRVDPRKHIFKAGGPSWGLNEYIIRNLVTIGGFVAIETAVSIYILSAEDVLSLGYYLHHKKSGFELQIFVKLSKWYKEAK